ncbi:MULTISPECIES: hypothetical protein [Rhizobium]|uniref:hypothetical protein n=1 Tax=Rhizobium TaxID=379 RepID=UPI001FEDF74D|nr:MULTISPECIES: hypothetical protein [Rhizobium]
MKAAFNLPCETSPPRFPAGSGMGGSEQRALTRIVGICLVLCLFPLPVSAHTTAKPLTGSAGHYCGKLLSSGLLVDVETSLQADPKGHISGTYRFDDDGNTTAGTLSEIGTTHGTVRTLRWFDKYGMGSLTIRFDHDYSRFEGLWGPEDAVPSYTWSGGNCGVPIS